MAGGFPKREEGNRQNVYPPGAYEGGNPAQNGRELVNSMAQHSVRTPSGRINNLFNTNGQTSALGLLVNHAIIPFFANNIPGEIDLETPNAKQLLFTSVIFSNVLPVQELPSGLSFQFQLTLNNVPVTDLLTVSSPLILEQMEPVSPLGAATLLPQLILGTFAPVQNYLITLDFDKVKLFNYSAAAQIAVAGLWAAGSARLTPINRGT